MVQNGIGHSSILYVTLKELKLYDNWNGPTLNVQVNSFGALIVKEFSLLVVVTKLGAQDIIYLHKMGFGGPCRKPRCMKEQNFSSGMFW